MTGKARALLLAQKKLHSDPRIDLVLDRIERAESYYSQLF